MTMSTTPNEFSFLTIDNPSSAEDVFDYAISSKKFIGITTIEPQSMIEFRRALEIDRDLDDQLARVTFFRDLEPFENSDEEQ